MKNHFTSTNLVAGALLLAAASPLSAENEWSIDWHSIDNGGVLYAESSDEQWQLSGTIGQWDATKARELSGSDWHLTGGFWGLTLEEMADRLFHDNFEAGEG